jgi:hypothetical protein
VGELAQRKKGLTAQSIDLMAAYRHDLSDNSPWRVGELPFALILETPAPANSPGTRLFELRPEWSFLHIR